MSQVNKSQLVTMDYAFNGQPFVEVVGSSSTSASNISKVLSVAYASINKIIGMTKSAINKFLGVGGGEGGGGVTLGGMDYAYNAQPFVNNPS